MDMDVNPEAGEAVLEVVRNQIAQNDPPITRQTLERLQGEGHSKDEAMRQIACVLLTEMHGMLRVQRAYDEEGYVAAVNALPQLPRDHKDG